jgi:hypothetical protein
MESISRHARVEAAQHPKRNDAKNRDAFEVGYRTTTKMPTMMMAPPNIVFAESLSPKTK